MSEMDWMYDSLTERFGENLGERQRVVDALLIAKSIVGPRTLGAGNPEDVISTARFILDEWGKCEDAEDPENSSVLDVGVITESDISLMKYGTYTFPEGSRWVNAYGVPLVFSDGSFWTWNVAGKTKAIVASYSLPFTRVKEEN